MRSGLTAPKFIEIAALFEDAMAEIYFRSASKGISKQDSSRTAATYRDRLADLERTTSIINDYMGSRGLTAPTRSASVDSRTGKVTSPTPIQPFVLQLQ